MTCLLLTFFHIILFVMTIIDTTFCVKSISSSQQQYSRIHHSSSILMRDNCYIVTKCIYSLLFGVTVISSGLRTCVYYSSWKTLMIDNQEFISVTTMTTLTTRIANGPLGIVTVLLRQAVGMEGYWWHHYSMHSHHQFCHQQHPHPPQQHQQHHQQYE